MDAEFHNVNLSTMSQCQSQSAHAENTSNQTFPDAMNKLNQTLIGCKVVLLILKVLKVQSLKIGKREKRKVRTERS